MTASRLHNRDVNASCPGSVRTRRVGSGAVGPGLVGSVPAASVSAGSLLASAVCAAWLIVASLVAIACGGAFAGRAVAAPVLPELSGRVVDSAGLLSAGARAELDLALEAFEAKTTDQIVVVTVSSLQGYPIEDFAVALGRKWGIGQKGKDNGVLMLVAPNDRKVRIEVGRGLEPLLPDGKAGTIIRQTILPAFRRGDFAGGLKAGVADIQAALTKDPAELEARSKRPPPPIDYSGYVVLALWLAIFAFVIYMQIRAARQMAQRGPLDQSRFDRGGRNARRRRFDDSGPIIVIPGSNGGWSGGFGGGSSGGGFSGGGGDFGGGGASGDW